MIFLKQPNFNDLTVLNSNLTFMILLYKVTTKLL